MPQDFVHLHVHSQYSLLEAAITIPKLCERVAKLGMKSVALTDSGNMFGAYEFSEQAKAHGLKPILGAQVYYLTAGDLTSRDVKRKDQFLANLILLVQNQEGYRNLCELLSLAHLKGFYYKPRLDKEVLRKHSAGLIALSGGIHGEVQRRLVQEEVEQAQEAATFLAETYPDRFYLELQDHGLPLELKALPLVQNFAQQKSLPMVVTNEVRYLDRKDSEAQRVLHCIQKGWTLHEAEDRLGTTGDQKYLKAPKDIIKSFKDNLEAIENSIKISEEIEFDYGERSYHFPQYQPPHESTLEDYLRQQTYQGFEERWPLIASRLQGKADELRQQYLDRIEEELKIILQMGFPGYFLIVADFIHYAKTHHIPVGPGRGSAAGSLVAYCLQITDIDPMPFDLLFERFLNPERISMPDVDIDFCMNRRDEVIQYVREKYGHVAQIITFGKMKAKAVIRDVGRVLDIPYSEVDKIAKLVPNALNITLEEAIKQEPRLKELEKSDPQVKRLLEIARSLEGLTRHASMHAAGVVIADQPLTHFLPLYKGPDGEAVTQFDMKAVESIGLIKFDFLGLKTLTVLEVALKMLQQTRGQTLKLEEISLEDEAVYQRLGEGDGLGVFQLESSGMRDLMVRLKPNCFEDIVALVALYRPGPLGSGMVDDFIDRKHGRKEASYDLEQLRQILEPTYGVIVYQEQVMQIASRLAHYSLGEADLLRRAMGKKKPEEMAKQQARFMQGARQNEIPEAKAKKIFELMAKFAEYGFNKSHSAAYALVSYYTAYLKTHYTVEYIASLLTHEMSNTDKILLYLNDARRHGLLVLPPDINQSDRFFSVENESAIRFGLAGVKGVGEAAIASILEERKEQGSFTSIFEFCSRVDLRKVNKKVLESLIKCGAFDQLHPNRAQLFQSLDRAMDWGAKRKQDSHAGQTTMFDLMSQETATPSLPATPEWSDLEKLGFEKQALGFYLSGHPLSRYQEQIKRLASDNTQSCLESKEKRVVGLCGIVATLKEIRTKRGKRMAFLSFEDLLGSIEVVVFNEVYEKAASLLHSEMPLYVKGMVEPNEDTPKILAEEITSLDRMRMEKTQSVHLRVNQDLLNRHALETLKDTLGKYPGTLPTYLHVMRAGESVTILEMPPDLQVQVSEGLVQEVEGLLGRSALVLQ